MNELGIVAIDFACTPESMQSSEMTRDDLGMGSAGEGSQPSPMISFAVESLLTSMKETLVFIVLLDERSRRALDD